MHIIPSYLHPCWLTAICQTIQGATIKLFCENGLGIRFVVLHVLCCQAGVGCSGGTFSKASNSAYSHLLVCRRNHEETKWPNRHIIFSQCRTSKTLFFTFLVHPEG